MQSKKLKNTRVGKINKKRLKISLVVLDAVKSKFLQTQEFIDSTLKKEYEKEKMTADEVIFLLLNLKKKISLDKRFCFRFKEIIFLFIDAEGLGR